MSSDAGTTETDPPEATRGQGALLVLVAASAFLWAATIAGPHISWIRITGTVVLLGAAVCTTLLAGMLILQQRAQRATARARQAEREMTFKRLEAILTEASARAPQAIDSMRADMAVNAGEVAALLQQVSAKLTNLKWDAYADAMEDLTADRPTPPLVNGNSVVPIRHNGR